MKVKDIIGSLINIQLDESFKDFSNKFINDGIDEQEVKQKVELFKKLSKSGKITGRKKDIGYWMNKDWNDFVHHIEYRSKLVSKRQQKKIIKKDSIHINHNEILIVIPLTKQASIQYGKNTKWCTAASDFTNLFDDYFFSELKTLFYLINDNAKMAFALDADQEEYRIFDERDNMTNEQAMFDDFGVTVDALKKYYNENKNRIEKKRIEGLGLTEEEIVNKIQKNPHTIHIILHAGVTPTEDMCEAALLGEPDILDDLLQHNVKLDDDILIDTIYNSKYSIGILHKHNIALSGDMVDAALSAGYLSELLKYGFELSDEHYDRAFKHVNNVLFGLKEDIDFPVKYADDLFVRHNSMRVIETMFEYGYIPSKNALLGVADNIDKIEYVLLAGLGLPDSLMIELIEKNKEILSLSAMLSDNVVNHFKK